MRVSPLFTRALALLILISFLQSCSPEKAGIYRNGQIRSGKRDDFHALNTTMLAALKENSAFHLESVMSKDLINYSGKLRLVELISNHMKDGDCKLMDEYYIVNDKKGDNTIKITNQSINNYNLGYTADAREMYFAFYTVGSAANKWLISAVYNKLDYGWKITQLNLSPYTLNGKTAPELFKLAKEDYDKHYLVDAVNTMEQARTCLNPYGTWQYTAEPEMKDFYIKMMAEANKKYLFPLVIREVPTEPRIYSVYNETRPDGVFPMVYYQSKIKLSDTVALKRENESIRKVIGKVIPGIDKDKKYVFYTIYNKMPHLSESADRYQLTEKLQ